MKHCAYSKDYFDIGDLRVVQMGMSFCMDISLRYQNVEYIYFTQSFFFFSRQHDGDFLLKLNCFIVFFVFFNLLVLQGDLWRSPNTDVIIWQYNQKTNMVKTTPTTSNAILLQYHFPAGTGPKIFFLIFLFLKTFWYSFHYLIFALAKSLTFVYDITQIILGSDKEDLWMSFFNSCQDSNIVFN